MCKTDVFQFSQVLVCGWLWSGLFLYIPLNLICYALFTFLIIYQVFGFLATVAFIVDAVQMVLKKRKVKEEKPEIAANTVNPTENQPLNNPQV